jgi:non-homologous end joining protein Ku
MKSGHFEPQKFKDEYENALNELLKKKQAGQPVELPESREPARVVNLMEALRQSVEASRAGGNPPAPSAKAHEAKREPSKKPKSRRAS